MNQNNRAMVPQLGHFLTYRHWLQGLKLLEYQLDTKENNRHFRTLDMCYYEKLKGHFKKFKAEKYFKSRVKNNLFYGLSEEFAILPYTLPKSNLGLRRHKFMTCPMRVLYYAIGLYLLELSEEFLKHYYKSHKNIISSYGGNLRFEDGELKLTNTKSIYYKSHYQKYRRNLRKEIREKIKRKVVIRLDIQNYFDELSIPKFLELLKKHTKESTQKEMNFDETTQAQLISFFDFVAGGTSGIPQLNNDVISGFLGHLFLAFGDLFLDHELRENNEPVESYTIIRYMDDIHIPITFKEKNDDLRNRFLHSLAPRISECLYENLGLRLNVKTNLFDLNKKEERTQLERNLKRVSTDFEIADEENDEPPPDKIKNIIRQLKKLKRSGIDPYFQKHRELDEEMLKEVYDENVKQMLDMTRTKSRLESVFMESGGFDFDLVNADPAPIIILMLKCDSVRKEFERFLLSKSHLTPRDIFLTLTYLCQVNFNQPQLLRLLKQSRSMKKIMEIFASSKLPSKSLGHYELTSKQTLSKSINQPYVIEQIRFRVLCEQKGDYSVALNHLLNEIHAICKLLDKNAKNTKNYEAQQVNKFLKIRQVRTETRVKIWNLFDRRNKNPVSHADPIAWPVVEGDYFEYRQHVGDCLKQLL